VHLARHHSRIPASFGFKARPAIAARYIKKALVFVKGRQFSSMVAWVLFFASVQTCNFVLAQPAAPGLYTEAVWLGSNFPGGGLRDNDGRWDTAEQWSENRFYQDGSDEQPKHATPEGRDTVFNTRALSINAGGTYTPGTTAVVELFSHAVTNSILFTTHEDPYAWEYKDSSGRVFGQVPYLDVELKPFTPRTSSSTAEKTLDAGARIEVRPIWEDVTATFTDLDITVDHVLVKDSDAILFPGRSSPGLLIFDNSVVETRDGFNVESEASLASLRLANSTFSTASSDSFGYIDADSRFVTEGTVQLNTKIVNEGTWGVLAGDTRISGFLDGTGSVILDGGGSLILDPGQYDVVAQTISGVGALIVESGTIKLTGSNTFSGGLFLEGGVTRVSRGGNTGGLDNTIHFDGGELQFLEGGNFVAPTWNVKSDSVISAANGQVEAKITGNFTGNGQIEIKGMDGGKVFLRGNNSGFTGDFLVSEGQLLAGVNDSLSSQTGITVREGATFALEGNENWGSIQGHGSVDINEYNAKVFDSGTSTLYGALRGSGTFTMAGTGEVRFDTNALIQNFDGDMAVTNGQLELNGFSISRFDGKMTTSGEGVAEFNTRSADLTFDGTFVNNGRLLKTGSGTLTVSPNSSASNGVVEVAQGTLHAIGRIPGTTLEMSGGTFEAGTNITVDNLAVSGGESTLATGANDFFVRDSLVGGGNLTKTGAGAFRFFSGANATEFTGKLSVAEGAVRLTNMAKASLAIQSGATATVRSGTVDIGSIEGGGTLELLDLDDGSLRSIRVGHNDLSTTFSGQVTGAGNFYKTGIGTLTMTGRIENANLHVEQGTMKLASATSAVFEQDIDLSIGSDLHIDQQFDFSGSLTGQGNVRLNEGTHAVTFRGNNESYAGTISVGAGRTLNVGRSNSLGGNSSIEIASGGNVRLEGAEYWGGLSGSGDLDLRGFDGRIGQGNQSSAFDGTITGSGDFAKIGTGDFTFNGDASGLTGDFTVMDGTLSGSGQFNHLTVEGGATLAIGNSPGVMTFENLDLEANSLLEIELGGLLAGSEFDQFVVTGDANINGNLSVSLLNGFELSAGQEFLIGDIGGDLNGQFAGLGEGSLVGVFGGQDLFISYQAGGGNNIGLFTAVPEPSSAVLLLVGAGLLTTRRSRQH
jgi:autotransporter-associated beta strand protein